MSQADRLLQACRRETVEVTPIWLMRQAGRYMAEYRALRERYSILELIKTPDLATEVTLQPIKTFNVDAAIIFSDILPLLIGMGLAIDFVKGDGPVVHNPLQNRADVEALTTPPAEATLSFTLQAIKQVKAELAGRLPLIGFSGAPFTLASYTIEGGSSRHYLKTKAMMYEQPQTWHNLMEKLAQVVGDYLRAQIVAGADVLQLFDSWAGALSPADYREYVLPYSQEAIEIARGGGSVPLIHFSTGTSGMLPLIREAGGDVISVDWRVDLGEVDRQLGPEVALQGNLDPTVLLAPIPEIKKQAARILAQVKGRPGYIFNLGHGILQQTPVDHVAALVDFVHAYSEEGYD